VYQLGINIPNAWIHPVHKGAGLASSTIIIFCPRANENEVKSSRQVIITTRLQLTKRVV